MTDTLEYALMAGGSYISNRNPKNQFPAPVGWTSYLEDGKNFANSGFEAAVFVRVGTRLETSPEIVISYTGTNGPGDIPADLTIAAGKFSEQLMQAAQYYLDIRAAAPKDAKITFTGHSLGGGLAALMSVFFALPSTTFDQAPFKNAATFVQDDCALMLKSRLEAFGDKYKDGIAALTTYIAARAAAPGIIPNSGLVTTIRVDGELLDGGLGPYSPIGANNSGNYTFDHGAATWSGASVDLHSQALLTTFLQSRQSATAAGNATQTLNQVTKKLDLLRLIFVDKLFNADVNSSTENFLERLIKHEAGVRDSLGNTTLAADAMVTRFTKDLWKLAKDGGLTVNNNDVQDSTSTKLSQALIAFAMQKYYTETAGSAGAGKELYTEVNAGVSFKRTDVAANWSDALTPKTIAACADSKRARGRFGSKLRHTHKRLHSTSYTAMNTTTRQGAQHA